MAPGGENIRVGILSRATQAEKDKAAQVAPDKLKKIQDRFTAAYGKDVRDKWLAEFKPMVSEDFLLEQIAKNELVTSFLGSLIREVDIRSKYDQPDVLSKYVKASWGII